MRTETIIEPNEEIFDVEARVAEELRTLLSDAEIKFVGAMSVPMTGRPELDILAITDDIETTSQKLVSIGFKQGPVERGISFLKRMEGEIEVAIQVMNGDNKMVETHAKINELLKGDEELRKAYEEFKRTLNGLTREEYKKRKVEWMKENLLPRLEK